MNSVEMRSSTPLEIIAGTGMTVGFVLGIIGGLVNNDSLMQAGLGVFMIGFAAGERTIALK